MSRVLFRNFQQIKRQPRQSDRLASFSSYSTVLNLNLNPAIPVPALTPGRTLPVRSLRQNAVGFEHSILGLPRPCFTK
jgi:hypothetical protein